MVPILDDCNDYWMSGRFGSDLGGILDGVRYHHTISTFACWIRGLDCIY
jgi:hypothetical protein